MCLSKVWRSEMQFQQAGREHTMHPRYLIYPAGVLVRQARIDLLSLIDIHQLAREEVGQYRQSATSVSHLAKVGVCRYPDDPRPRERRKVVVLVLQTSKP